MALAEGMFSAAAAAVEAQKRHKKKPRHIDIETHRASQSRVTEADRRRARAYGRANAAIAQAAAHLSAPTVRPSTARERRDAEAHAIARALARTLAPDLERSARAAPGATRSGEAFLSAVIGPDLTKRLPIAGGTSSKGATTKGAALDLALLAPIFKGPRWAFRGIQAARRGEPAVAKVARESFREPVVKPALRRLRGKRRPGETYKPRTLRIGEKEQQLPKARSRITQYGIEKPADVVSRALERTPARNVPGLKLATSSMRASKAAGREAAQETVRESAVMGPHLKALKTSGDVDESHFWYAQLPKSHRNAEGLKLVRGKQLEELEELRSGRALASLNKRQGALEAELRASRGGEGRPHYEVLADLQDVKALKADLPQRVEDLAKSVVRLERLAAKAPSVDERKIEALRALSEDRKKTLIEAGVLDPDRAAQREGLVARWAGLEPTGEEIYMGHRLGKVRGARSSLMPVSIGTGRVRPPEGVSRENKLALAKSGRLQASLQPAKEDWQAAKVYKTNLRVRGDLAQMGRPLEGTRVPEGHVLVNPKGRPVPRTWKMPEELADGGFDPDELERAARELVDDFFAEEPHAIEAMLSEARETGLWPELRVLPKEIAERYFKQFTPGARGGPVLSAYDRLVDVTAASIVFVRIGYVPKNAVQNLIMSVPHQGPYLLANGVRAAQVLSDPVLRELVRGEVGFSGATKALGKEARTQKVVGKVVGLFGSVADDPFRTAAFLHEASAAGVIPRAKPILGAKDREKLLRLFTDKSQRPLLNDIRSRSVEAMADFSRLTPAQRKSLRRVLVIPGWLMAGSRYPIHFGLTHPLRSALLAYVAMGSPGAPEKYRPIPPVKELFAQDLPSWTEGIKADIPLVGGKGKVLRTTSINPVSTPWEILQAGVETARGNRDFAAETAFDYANPLGAAAVRFSQGEGVESFKRLAPNIGFAEGLIHPKASKYYPEDKTRLGRFYRELGVVPIKIRRSREQFTPVQRARQDVLDNRNQMAVELEQRMPDLLVSGKLPPELRESWKARSLYKSRAAALEHKQGSLEQIDRFRLAAQTMVALGKWTPSQAAREIAATERLDEAEIERRKNWLLRNPLGGYRLSWVGSQLRERGSDYELD